MIVVVQGKSVVLTNLAKCQMIGGEVFPILNTYAPIVPPMEHSCVFGG